MSAEKLTTIFGAAVAIEAGGYGLGGTPNLTTDGLLLTEAATLTRGFVAEGQRSAAPGGMGVMTRQPPAGPTGSVALSAQFIGAGAAYSASNKSHLHNALRVAGYVATLDDGVSYTYTPQSWDGSVPPAFASGVVDLYGRGEKYTLNGAYSDLSVEVETGGVAAMTFDLQGRPDVAPTETTLPSITYPTLQPAKADSIAFTIGTYTGASVRSISFSQGRNIALRSIWGYAPGRRVPTLTATIEQPRLATSAPWHTATLFNPERLWEAGTALAIGFTVGSVAFNRLKFAAPAAVISNVEYSEDGPVALATITFECSQTTATAADDHSWIMD